jgi:hypothetical protein
MLARVPHLQSQSPFRHLVEATPHPLEMALLRGLPRHQDLPASAELLLSLLGQQGVLSLSPMRRRLLQQRHHRSQQRSLVGRRRSEDRQSQLWWLLLRRSLGLDFKLTVRMAICKMTKLGILSHTEIGQGLLFPLSTFIHIDGMEPHLAWLGVLMLT